MLSCPGPAWPAASFPTPTTGTIFGTFPADDYFAQICIKCYCGETNFERLDRARELAHAKGLTVAQIAVAFAQSQPMNLFLLVSSLTQDQFVANAAAIDITLTPQELAYLDLGTA